MANLTIDRRRAPAGASGHPRGAAVAHRQQSGRTPQRGDERRALPEQPLWHPDHRLGPRDGDARPRRCPRLLRSLLHAQQRRPRRCRRRDRGRGAHARRGDLRQGRPPRRAAARTRPREPAARRRPAGDARRPACHRAELPPPLPGAIASRPESPGKRKRWMCSPIFSAAARPAGSIGSSSSTRASRRVRGAGYDSGRMGDTAFSLYGTPRDGTTLDQLAAAFDTVVADLVAKGVTDDELQRAIEHARADAIYSEDSPGSLARAVGGVLATGGTLADVQSMAGTDRGGYRRRGRRRGAQIPRRRRVPSPAIWLPGRRRAGHEPSALRSSWRPCRSPPVLFVGRTGQRHRHPEGHQPRSASHAWLVEDQSIPLVSHVFRLHGRRGAGSRRQGRRRQHAVRPARRRRRRPRQPGIPGSASTRLVDRASFRRRCGHLLSGSLKHARPRTATEAARLLQAGAHRAAFRRGTGGAHPRPVAYRPEARREATPTVWPRMRCAARSSRATPTAGRPRARSRASRRSAWMTCASFTAKIFARDDLKVAVVGAIDAGGARSHARRGFRRPAGEGRSDAGPGRRRRRSRQRVDIALSMPQTLIRFGGPGHQATTTPISIPAVRRGPHPRRRLRFAALPDRCAASAASPIRSRSASTRYEHSGLVTGGTSTRADQSRGGHRC